MATALVSLVRPISSTPDRSTALIIGAVAKRTGNLHKGFRVAVIDACLLLGLVIAHLVYALSGK